MCSSRRQPAVLPAQPLGLLLARGAAQAGLAAQLDLLGRSLKSALKHADRLDARYVAIVETDSRVLLKEMSTGAQHELPDDSVIPEILRGRGQL